MGQDRALRRPLALDVPRRRVRRDGQPRLAGREARVAVAGPCHRRPAAITVPPSRHPQGRAIPGAAAGDRDVQGADLLPVVEEWRPPQRQLDRRGGLRHGIGRRPIATTERVQVPRDMSRADRGWTARSSASDRPRRPRGQRSTARKDAAVHAVSRRTQSNTRWRGAQYSTAASMPLVNSSPTVAVPGRASTMSRNSARSIVQLGLVLVVAVLLAVPGDRAARRDLRVRGHVGGLDERVEDVEPEPIDAAVEPAPDHRPHLRAKRGAAPVHVGLLGQERVEVELLSPGLPLPGRPAEPREPVVRRLRSTVAIPPGRIPPEIEVGERSGPRLARLHEPRMLVAGVVHHEVEDDADASSMAGLDQPIEVGQRPEDGIDRRVIRDVVAAVEHGRRVDRREPDGVDAERIGPAGEMVQVVDEPREVADPVAVRVGEAPRVHLVDDAVQPPSTGCVEVGSGC